MYGVNVMPEHTALLWEHRFSEEKPENIHDNERSGQLSTASTNEMRQMLLAILKQTEGSRFMKFGICWKTNTVSKFPK